MNKRLKERNHCILIRERCYRSLKKQNIFFQYLHALIHAYIISQQAQQYYFSDKYIVKKIAILFHIYILKHVENYQIYK